MLRRNVIIFTLLTALFTTPCMAGNEWRFIREKDGVQVSTRSMEGFAVKEFRGETTIHAPVEVAYEVLNDSEHFPEWFGDCGYQETTCRIDNNSKVIHHIVNVPVLKDRNVVAKVEFQTDFDTGILKTLISALPDERVPGDCPRESCIPASTDFVRITTLTCTFDIERIDNGSSRVVYTVLVDPGGHIPAWIANYFAESNPVVTLSRFKEMLKQPAYWELASLHQHKQLKAPEGNL